MSLLPDSARRLPRSAAWRATRAFDRLFVERPRGFPRAGGGFVWLDSLGLGEPDRNDYAPSPWRVLPDVLHPEDVGRDDVFLDIGCGMGRALLVAAERYPFSRVIGVEIAQSLADAAREVMAGNAHRFRCREWTVETADAATYVVPGDVTVAYLYDPFVGALLDKVLAALISSVDERPRRLRLIYLTPVDLPRLQATGRFVITRRGFTSLWRTGVAYEYVVGEVSQRGDSNRPLRSPAGTLDA